MNVDILEASQLCCGLGAEQIQEVANSVRRVRVTAGQVVFRQDEPGDSMFIVVRGRVKIEVTRAGGSTQVVDHLGVGEHFGEVAMLTGGRRAVTMTAVTDAELWELKQDTFQQWLLSAPGLAANVCRTLGYRLRRETAGRPARFPVQSVALVNLSPATRDFLPRFASALSEHCESVVALTDAQRPRGWDLREAWTT